MKSNYLKPASAWTLALLLTACGGGGGGGSTPSQSLPVAGSGGEAAPSPPAPSTPKPAPTPTTPVAPGGPTPDPTLGTGPVTPVAAAHFLAQATFGPTSESISALTASSKAAWINSQFAKPRVSHRAHVEQVAATLTDGARVNAGQVYETFWKQAVTGDDQLRQRMAFALSQIFVVSVADGTLASKPAGVASYYDTLGEHAFGNFRDLLQAVALHPVMGVYLSHLHNQKESGTRVPDENFAREVMQLMTIGLHQLNQDGSLQISNGKPIPTYTGADVAGLAKVFTGWSYAGPDQSVQRFVGGRADPARDWTPMQMYSVYHSTSPKSFLGVSIGAGSSGEADLKIALDTLFNHPNVGPFIGRQLIQRLVTSNPSPAYVGRVAAAFNNNGAGVRGDLRAVIRAVLLDAEAADTGTSRKLREPVLRLANWMRAFNAQSSSGRFQIGSTDDPLTSLGQTPLRSPSVFNFFRPGYMPPNTALAAAGMAAPEMQITGEPSVTGYLNYMQSAIPNGAGSGRDVKADYSAELALAGSPEQLVDRVKLLLLNGVMSTTLRQQIIGALNAISQPAANGSNAAQVETARKNRVYMAIYLAMASPEYLAQR